MKNTVIFLLIITPFLSYGQTDSILIKRNEDLIIKNHELKKQITELQVKHNIELKNNNSNAQSCELNFSNAKDKIEELNGYIKDQELKHDKNKLKKENGSLKKTNDELLGEKKIMKEQIQIKDSYINDLKKEISGLESKVNELDLCKSESQKVTTNLEKSKLEKLGLEKEIKSLSGQVEKKDKELADFDKKIQNYKIITEQLIKELQNEIAKYIAGDNFISKDKRFIEFENRVEEYLKYYPADSRLVHSKNLLNEHKKITQVILNAESVIQNDFNKEQAMAVIANLNNSTNTNTFGMNKITKLRKLITNYCAIYNIVAAGLRDNDEYGTESFKKEELRDVLNNARGYPYLIYAVNEKLKPHNIMKDGNILKPKPIPCN